MIKAGKLVAVQVDTDHIVMRVLKDFSHSEEWKKLKATGYKTYDHERRWIKWLIDQKLCEKVEIINI